LNILIKPEHLERKEKKKEKRKKKKGTLILLATSIDSFGGMPGSLSLRSC